MSLLSLFPSHTYHTHSLRQIQLLMKKYFLIPTTQPLRQICIQQSTSKLPKVKFSNCTHTCWRKETPLFLCHTLVPHTSKFESFLSEVFWVPPPSYTLLFNCFVLQSALFLTNHTRQLLLLFLFLEGVFSPKV